MKESSLEVTYRRGRLFAAYLYLPQDTTDKSYRTSKSEPGMIIDFNKIGRAIGIEITAPSKVTIVDINRVLSDIGAPPLTEDELAPLLAA